MKKKLNVYDEIMSNNNDIKVGNITKKNMEKGGLNFKLAPNNKISKRATWFNIINSLLPFMDKAYIKLLRYNSIDKVEFAFSMTSDELVLVKTNKNKIEITSTVKSDTFYSYLLLSYLYIYKEDCKDAMKKAILSPNSEGNFLYISDYIYNLCLDLDNNYEINVIEEEVSKQELFKYISNMGYTTVEGFEPINDVLCEETLQESNPNGMWKDILDGKYHVNDVFNTFDKERIPKRDLKQYIPNNDFYSIVKRIWGQYNKVLKRMDNGLENIDLIDRNFCNFLITGKPSTGKTYDIHHVACAMNLPVYVVECSKFTEEDTFQGTTKCIDGTINSIATEFVNACKRGGIVILEEVNLINPSVIMGAIGQLLEYPFVLEEQGIIPIKRHPLLYIFATMNTGTQGSNKPNEAFVSRFKTAIYKHEIKEEDFLKILQCNGEYDLKDCKYVYEFYNRLLNYINSPTINRQEYNLLVTMRQCFGFLENLEVGDDKRTAIKNSFIGTISSRDTKFAEEVERDVLDLMPI